MDKQLISNNALLIPVIGLAALLGAVGGNMINTASVDAQSADTAQSATIQQQPQNGKFDPSKGGHTANGKTEELLIGDTADKVTAAALKTVSGGTIIRVETDADGAVYEAHMKKADGSEVTVLFDGNFSVTGTQSGRGPGRGPAKTL